MKPYQLTLQDLRRSCPLLKTIEVGGGGSKAEELVGRNHLGEIVVRQKGKVTPALVIKFRDAYTHAVTAGLIKAPPIPVEQEPQ